LVVTASADHTGKIWDAATGKERATLSGHTDGAIACAISPHSDFVVTASDDHSGTIWDAATGKERATLTGHTDRVTACAISPDSSLVVTASYDKTCKIWDAATGKERATLPLLGSSECVALQGWQPFAACGDAGGGVYVIELVGIEYGPIIVTAVDLGKGAEPALRCPKCLRLHPLVDASLGEVIECPTPDCSLSLRVNPFVTRMAMRGQAVASKSGTRATAAPPRLPAERPDHALGATAAAGPRAKDTPTPRKSTPASRPPQPAAPAPRPVTPPTLATLLLASSLKSQEIGGAHVVLFSGMQTERVVVQVRELPGGLLGLYTSLPEVRRHRDRAYRHLLEASFQASYAKAFLQDSGALVLAAEVPLATLSPESFTGICTGLAALGDVNKDDLTADAALKTQLSLCTLAQAGHIALDREAETERLKDLLSQAGLPCRERGPGVLSTSLRLIAELECSVRVLPTCISLILYLGGIQPKKEDKLGRLLTLNRSADVAKCGLDSDGDVALLYEVPALYDGLLDHLISQFTPLLMGAVVVK
jgi:hypothetical protein